MNIWLLADVADDIVLAVGAILLVVGIAGAWLIPRFTPKGTLLAIAAVLYIASSMIEPGDDRARLALVGLLRMLGLIGGVLGIVDLLRKRKL
jgi:hypothetical protein